MKNNRHLRVVPAAKLSNTSEDSTPIMTQFMLRNPFKKLDWLVVGILTLLVSAGLLFYLALRLIAES